MLFSDFFWAPITVAWTRIGRQPPSLKPTPAEVAATAAAMPLMCETLKRILARYPETQLRQWEDALRAELAVVRSSTGYTNEVCAFVVGAGREYAIGVYQGLEVPGGCESEELILVVPEVIAKLWLVDGKGGADPDRWSDACRYEGEAVT
jgi:hypothetical protein